MELAKSSGTPPIVAVFRVSWEGKDPLLMRFLALLFLPALVATALWMAVPVASANGPTLLPRSWTTGDCVIQSGQFKAKCIPELVGHIIVTIAQLLGAFFLINVMIAGYQIALGSWTGENAAGKDRLQWSVIGLIVCICAYLILNLFITVIVP